MASICSRHQGYDPDCKMCNTHPRAIFPDWDEKVREAEEAGLTTCKKCSFEYYLTVDYCPLCGHLYGANDATETDQTD